MDFISPSRRGQSLDSIFTLKSIGDGQSRITEIGRRKTPVLEKFNTRLLRYDAAGAGDTSRQRESKSGKLAQKVHRSDGRNRREGKIAGVSRDDDPGATFLSDDCHHTSNLNASPPPHSLPLKI